MGYVSSSSHPNHLPSPVSIFPSFAARRAAARFRLKEVRKTEKAWKKNAKNDGFKRKMYISIRIMISVDINNMLYFHFHECVASCFYVHLLEGQSIKFSWVPVFGRYLTSLCLVCMCWFLSSIELDSLLLSYTFLLYFALPKGSSL